MKRNYKYLLLVAIAAVAFWSFRPKQFDNPEKDKLLIELITFVLERGHFDPKDIDDNFSENVFMDFINELDPQKRYFYASDIKDFEPFKYRLDEQIQSQDITFFNVAHERLMQRMEEAQRIYEKVLEEPFDYSKDESINVDFESLPYVRNKKEMIEKWRKQLKFSTLSGYDDRVLDNEKAEEKKTLQEIEEEARTSTLNTLNDYFDIINDLERKDWFSIYINAIVQEFDPHTFYFAPEDKDRFDMRMSGKFEGIGARLQKKDGNIKIVEVISGGPTWRDNLLDVGDTILKVAQGEEEPVEITGMRLDDAVKLIKGPKGTEVKLTVKRVDGNVDIVSIIRDVVELEEAYAKSALVKKGDRKFGLINLPQFYIDFKNPEKVNAAADVKREIERLKSQGMEGLVIDLRGNGGGSLATVVDMAGLFIKQGPIVQVKSVGERKEVLKDRDQSISWDGPLVIMVNELSASASEILAAAMQDYKRAIVIGSKQTYGKGTVQNVYDLNQFIRSSTEGDVGALKVTTQKFYRVNGGSTQLEGVESDIVIADRYSYIDIGEKDQDNPLPWDKINPAKIEPWDGYIDYQGTIKNSNERMKQNNYIQLIEENAKWLKTQSDNNTYTLNYAAYKQEVEEDEAYLERFKTLEQYTNTLSFQSLPYEVSLFETDSILMEKRTRWHKSLSQDVYIDEAINVLQDLQLNYLQKQKVANVKG